MIFNEMLLSKGSFLKDRFFESFCFIYFFDKLIEAQGGSRPAPRKERSLERKSTTSASKGSTDYHEKRPIKINRILMDLIFINSNPIHRLLK